MKGSRNSLFIAIFLMVIMSVGLINAAVIISGKVYDPVIDAKNNVAGAYVLATCYGSPTLSTYTNSNPDGSYAIGFDSINCSSTDKVEISSSKGSRYGTTFNFIVKDRSIPVLSNFFIIENLVLDKTTSLPSNRGGGRNARYYQCGNGLCDLGESPETCPQDCGLPPVVEEEPEIQEPIELAPTEQETTTGFFSSIANGIGGITGAVTGTLGTAGTWLVGVFLVGIVGMSITVRSIRKRRLKAK